MRRVRLARAMYLAKQQCEEDEKAEAKRKADEQAEAAAKLKEE